MSTLYNLRWTAPGSVGSSKSGYLSMEKHIAGGGTAEKDEAFDWQSTWTGGGSSERERAGGRSAEGGGRGARGNGVEKNGAEGRRMADRGTGKRG